MPNESGRTNHDCELVPPFPKGDQLELDEVNMKSYLSSTTASLLSFLFFVAILLASILVPPALVPSTSSTRSLLATTANTPASGIPELQSYVQYSYAAFCPDEELYNWTCQWCLDEEFQVTAVLFNETTKTKGYLGYLPSRNLVLASFRGSYGHAENWWLNLRLGTTKDFYNVKIRTGWVLAYQALREQILKALEQTYEKCPSCSTFVTTGHSLGATIGALAALDVKLLSLENEFPWIQRVEMRTIGMPRVGYKDFADLFQETVDSSFRVVHYRDIVPHYPVRIPYVVPYHHVGSELWVPDKQFNDSLVVCNGSGEDPECSNSIAVWHWDPDDHNLYLGLQNNDCGTRD